MLWREHRINTEFRETGQHQQHQWLVSLAFQHHQRQPWAPANGQHCEHAANVSRQYRRSASIMSISLGLCSHATQLQRRGARVRVFFFFVAGAFLLRVRGAFFFFAAGARRVFFLLRVRGAFVFCCGCAARLFFCCGCAVCAARFVERCFLLRACTRRVFCCCACGARFFFLLRVRGAFFFFAAGARRLFFLLRVRGAFFFLLRVRGAFFFFAAGARRVFFFAAGARRVFVFAAGARRVFVFAAGARPVFLRVRRASKTPELRNIL